MNTQPLWRIWLAENARAVMLGAAAEAHPRETGGVLIGVHTHGSRPWVTDAVELRSPRSTSVFYEVPSGARRHAVRKLQRKDSRLGYLGEWHAHPLDAPASSTDIATIGRLALDPESGCSRPVLFVLRRTAAEYAIDATQSASGTLHELRIIATGKLPEPGEARATTGRRSYARRHVSRT